MATLADCDGKGLFKLFKFKFKCQGQVVTIKDTMQLHVGPGGNCQLSGGNCQLSGGNCQLSGNCSALVTWSETLGVI